ncbi:MAG TPA: hypothetical protein VGE29_03010 [Prosthecobacter sp.]
MVTQKIEIDSLEKLETYLNLPGRTWERVILQGLDLVTLDDILGPEVMAATTSFLGCVLGPRLASGAARSGALIIPPRPGLDFDPFRTTLYRWSDLLDRFDAKTPESYRNCRDWLCYMTAMNEVSKKKRTDLGVDDELLFRLHDFAQEDALLDYLKPSPADASTWKKVVAIMGGHDLPRLEKKALPDGKPSDEDAPYMRAALLAWHLGREGYLVATGGGPGAMEAGNLGAFFHKRPEDELRAAVRTLEKVPKVEPVEPGSPRWNSGEWLAPAVGILNGFLSDPDKTAGESVGIPTWFYGHEPPNVFATHIAKYFENSLREEGLLAVATHGVIFAEGNAGTVQEIFQDACQNYYATYGPATPMVLLDSAYWNRSGFGEVGVKHKPVWPLLQQLASERKGKKPGDLDMAHTLLLTDSIEDVIAHIVKLDPLRQGM